MGTTISRAGLPALSAIALAVLAGCGGVNELTKERVARSETSVRQAQQTAGNSEAAAVDLQRARDNLERAQKALNDKNEKLANQAAQQAQLDAELAVAKSQSASARKAADELLASIQTLRQEAGLGACSQTPMAWTGKIPSIRMRSAVRNGLGDHLKGAFCLSFTPFGG